MAAVTDQRRILTVLVGAQILSGAGLAAGITVGALLAQRMLGGTSLAGLPAALFTLGSALAAFGVGRVSQARGRRTGLALGYAVGAVGSLGVVVAATVNSPALLFVALFVYGSGFATNLQARYAGADLAPADRRARAVSIVLVATTVGGVLGPVLTTATDAVAVGVGLPPLTGPFALAALAYAAAALLLTALLRPDPLLRARELSAGEPVPASAGARWSPAVLGGAAIMVVTQLVMIAVMTMTPVYLTEHGHGVGAAGTIIALHVAAMYLPAPVSGWLVDRYGVRPTALLAGGVLLGAGLLAGLAPSDALVPLALALILLGLGWNLGLLSGTTALTNALDPASRAATQGVVDVAVALAGAAGGLGSGFVVAATGFPLLALVGGLLAAVTIPLAGLVAFRVPRRSARGGV